MQGTVLVAHNDSTTLELMSAVLMRNGFEVVSTNDGGDALARFFETSPDVVVCDNDLPSLTGAQLCKQIRAQGSATKLVVICSAGSAQDNEPALCAELNCDAVLERPFRFGPLRDLLAEWGLGEEEEEEEEEEEDEETLTFSVPIAPPELVSLKDVEVAPPTPPQADGAAPIPVPIPIPLIGPGAPASGPKLELDAGSMPEATKLGREDALVAKQRAEDAVTPGPEAPVEEVPPAAQAKVEAQRDTEAQVRAEREALRADLARRAEKTALPDGVPRTGDLVSMPLPRLVFELYLGTYTGILHLTHEGATRSIYFRGGFPVFVESTQLDETLSSILMKSGRISAEQNEEAMAVASERGIFLGQAFVAIGALREAELLDALREQTEYKLMASFAWRDGSYTIEDETEFPEKMVLSEIHPLTGILRGISAHYELSALFAYFSKLQSRYVVSTPLFAVYHGSVLPHLEHFPVAELLDGKTTFEEALRSDDAHSLEIAQALYVLLVTDMVRPSKKPGDPAPEIEAVTEEQDIGLADYDALMDAADRIAHRYLQTKEMDHFALLGLARDASTRDIARASRKLVAQIRRDAGLPGLPADSARRARELIDRLDTARSVLTHAERRAEYVATLDEEEPEPDPRGADQARDAFRAAERDYRQGVRLLEESDVEGAYAKLDAAVRSNPVEPTYRVALAQAILVKFAGSSGQALGLAYSHIEQALRSDPGNLLANLEAARIFLGEDQLSEARVHVERVLQRVPHHKAALALLAEIESKGDA